jgi:hypothetical protein
MAGWPGALEEWFWALGYAPESFNCDQASALFDCLRHIGVEGRVPPRGILLWLAAGVEPYVHAQARPSGGSHAEAGVKAAKDHLNRLCVKRAVERELAGCGLQRARKFGSELEFGQVFAEFRATANNRVFRGAQTRAEFWALGAEQRAARALAENLREITREVDGHPVRRVDEILACARVVPLCGGRLPVRVHGRAVAADLTAGALELLRKRECPAADLAAVVCQGGLRAGDDPDLVRVVVIQPNERGGQPRYHAVEARCAQVDEYFQDLRKPVRGEYRGRVEGTADALARARETAAREHRERVGALREGTTGEVVQRVADL